MNPGILKVDVFFRLTVPHDALQALADGRDEPPVQGDYDIWGTLQTDLEGGGAAEATVEARINLGVLRRILAGGLLTNERVARHRKDGGSKVCRCGAPEATVLHVSWECPRYADERRALLQTLRSRLELAERRAEAGRPATRIQSGFARAR